MNSSGNNNEGNNISSNIHNPIPYGTKTINDSIYNVCLISSY